MGCFQLYQETAQGGNCNGLNYGGGIKMEIVERIKQEAERRGIKVSAEEEKAQLLLKSQIREIGNQLIKLDREYLTLRVLGNAHLNDDFAIIQIKKHEEEAIPLRLKRKELISQLSDI